MSSRRYCGFCRNLVGLDDYGNGECLVFAASKHTADRARCPHFSYHPKPTPRNRNEK
ncbi:MAG: hypothetical protein HDS67_02325 [Bacteroidales bacterium]|nr:hypothetical protein [Bacteroidales bacterium]